MTDKPMVLVVDDDLVHHKLFRLISDRLDITPFLAASCTQALCAIQESSFDLVLMDCRMPDVDGYTCTAKIRSLESPIRDIPIVAVTACVLPGDREKCINAGMNDFLGKPFTIEQLNSKIQEWLPAHKRK